MTFALILPLLLAQTTPSPTPTECAFRPARVTRAVQPNVPRSFWQTANLTQVVTVQVKVTVRSDGSVKDASIWKSSGYKVLDDAALQSARLSGYSPTMVNCTAVDGDYTFRADFAPQ
jgi:TonB family protein